VVPEEGREEVQYGELGGVLEETTTVVVVG
jgi:hypothetical protein